MRSILRYRWIALSAVVVIVTIGFVPPSVAGFFSFTAFAYPGASQTWAFGINSDGDIVGFYSLDGYHGYLLRHDQFTALDDPPWGVRNTMAFGINDEGQIVGHAGNEGFVLTGGVYQPIIAPFPNVTDTVAEAINNAGQIVGWYFANSQQHGFLLDRGVYSSIDVSLTGASNTAATGINDNGQIVGYFTLNGRTTGFLLSNGTYTAIDIPGQDGSGFLPLPAQAFGINNFGEVVGVYSDGVCCQHGFLYFDGVFMLPINVALPGGLDAAIYGINNKGSMVATNGGSNAFLIVPTPLRGGENQQ
jgi:probable HAF family extracellular repeat protein